MRETSRQKAGLRPGKRREGKGQWLLKQKHFIPKRFLNAATSVTPSHGTPLFPPVDVVATNFFYMYFSTNKSNIWELLFVLQVFSVSVFVFKCLVKGCTAQQLTYSVFWRMWQTCSGVVLLFSHFSLSVSSSLTLAVCLCVCVCSFSGPLLWHKKKYWAAPFFVLLPVGN